MPDLLTAVIQPPPPEDVLNLPVALVGLLFLAGFVGGVLLTRPDADRFAARFGDPIVVRAQASVIARLCGVGLVLLGVRLLQTNPLALAAPIWLLLCALAVVGSGRRFWRGRPLPRRR